MSYVNYLEPFLRERRSLVIACHDCDTIDLDQRANGVFVHTCLCSMVNLDDTSEVSLIRYFIEDLACDQVILLGHTNCRAVKDILEMGRRHAPLRRLQRVITGAWTASACCIRHNMRIRIMTEQNIIHQVRAISTLPFVEEKINMKTLQVKGLCWDEASSTFNEICRNNIVFNDIVSQG
ncbi:MAG: hypothetical protein HC859_07015 [Bacteroidia bacterium]|nr:hypothetical protein [Bacteroidia bacterium]